MTMGCGAGVGAGVGIDSGNGAGVGIGIVGVVGSKLGSMSPSTKVMDSATWLHPDLLRAAREQASGRGTSSHHLFLARE